MAEYVKCTADKVEDYAEKEEGTPEGGRYGGIAGVRSPRWTVRRTRWRVRRTRWRVSAE